MKKVLVLCLMFSTMLGFSQYYDNGISATGFANGDDFNAQLNYSHRVFNYFDFIDVGVQVSSNTFELGSIEVPSNLIALNAAFYYDVIRNNRRFYYRNAFAITIGGGIQIGQESLDLSNIPLEEDESFNIEEDTIVFGPFVSANFDFYLNSFFAIAIRLSETYHVNSEVGNFSPYVGIGVKFVKVN